MSYPDAPPPQQAPAQGGFFTQKYLGIPGVVWLAGAAILAYFLFFRNKASGGGAGGTSTGGGGTSTTGDIQLQPGTETIDLTGTTAATGTGVTNTAPDTDVVNNPPPPGNPIPQPTPNPQPSPKPPPRVKWTWYTVQRGDTLKSIAKHYGISVRDLAHANVYVPGEVPGDRKVGQPLGTGAGLKTGQRLHVPIPG